MTERWIVEFARTWIVVHLLALVVVGVVVLFSWSWMLLAGIAVADVAAVLILREHGSTY